MEYFEGKPLDALLKSGPVPQASVVSVIYHTADGLKKAHANAVIHRDIKPANLMMSASGEVKILDFGIAKALDAKKDITGQTVLGTPYYMSPEQAMGHTIDGRTDIYSLGITAFHLITGKRPFEAKSKVDVMMMQVKNPLPDIHGLVAGVDNRVVKLIEKMCAKKADARFQSCQELMDAVEQLPRNLGGRAADDPNVKTAAPKPISGKLPPPAPAPTVEQRASTPAPAAPGRSAPGSAMRATVPPSNRATLPPTAPPVRVGAPTPNTPGRTPRPSSQGVTVTPARQSGQGQQRPEVRQAPPPQVPKRSRPWVGILLGALGAAAIGGGFFAWQAFSKPKAAWRAPTKGWVYPGTPAPPLKKVQTVGGYGNCIFSTHPLEAGQEDAASLRTTFGIAEDMSARCYLAHQIGPNKAGEVYQEMWIDGARRKQVIYDPPLANDADQVAVDVKQEYGALLGELPSGKHIVDLWLYRQGEDAENPEQLAAGEFIVRK